jgi:hypothetical protein
MLRYVGRMKRPDVRLAWREKVTITDYVWSLMGLTQNSPMFEFLDSGFVAVFKQRSGQDVTTPLNAVL